MKTIFTLLLATFFTTAAFAYDEGRLTITVASNKNVQVYVDGRAYQDNDNIYVLNNVQPGNHTIKIYRSGNNGRNNRNDKRNELLYSSTVYVRPSYHVDVMINRFGKALVDEKALSDRNGRWDDDDWNNGGYGNGGYNNGGYNNGGYNNGYNQAMSASEFDQLLSRIKKQWFASGKMNTAKEAIPANYYNTAQVRQLLQLFSSDSDKLELAKLAYRYTVDQRSYNALYDVFSFQNSRDELDRYIRDYRY